MKKIISLFARNYDGDRLVRDEVVPGAEWVQQGEGISYRKYDGTACMVRGGKLFKRYDCKMSKHTPPPKEFEPCQDPDPVTGHWPGWIPVGLGPEDKWHREAFDMWHREAFMLTVDDTYELCGPKIQGNTEGLEIHFLVPHTAEILDAPRTYQELKTWLENRDIEGIVWHHPDGRMVKIKKRDFWGRR